MKGPIFNYCKSVSTRFNSGISTEHSYRAELMELVRELSGGGINITNEPKRQKCGAPDFIVHKKDVPVGYIEAKDIGVDLDKSEKTEQLKRYLLSLSNLILTDYLEFRFYKHSEKVKEIRIASIENGKIVIHPEKFSELETYLKDFCAFHGITIKSAEKLAKMMAQKASLMEEVLYRVVTEDNENNTLKDQLRSFREVLIHDLEEKTFAEIYAQTIAYGLFAARLHDPVLETFSREEARGHIPKSNPFLRNLFDYVAGAQLDDRVVWIVDDLADIFRATDLKKLLADFGKATGQTDPFIHFYETFLSEYNPALRQKRGVYYTPEPVVNFIVRAVDDILKTEFGLKDGLADSSKTRIKVDSHSTDKRTETGYKKIDKEVHKVQILDPAAGTGTFLAEVIKEIYKKFRGQEGIWSNYVEEHLIPRINGFEILMAPYTVCHLKLEMLLNETGYNPKEDKKQGRLRAFLTNSLEEAEKECDDLFMARWLSDEAREATVVKKDMPVMVVIGNPPYSGESANKGEWIMKLMEDYKKEPGGKEKLNERNPKWINDDYVKFIRYGQHYIEKNGTGVLAYINPHGYLDNPTFRGMRWHILSTFDKIYTIDLHGNAKKKETCPDGSKDENVFDIQQGVSINLFIKTGKKTPNQLGTVFHYDLYGKREEKYRFLNENSIETIPYKKLPNKSPMYFMVQKDFELEDEYKKGFSLSELFPANSVGIVTARDSFTIHDSRENLKRTIEEFLHLSDEEARSRFNLGKDVRDWKISFARKDLGENYPDKGSFTKINYRPFEKKWTFYTGNSKGFHCYPRKEIMQHFLQGENVGLIFEKIIPASKPIYSDIFISINPHDAHSIGSASYIAPLYLYEEEMNLENKVRRPNLNMEIVEEIAEGLNLTFIPEKETRTETFAPMDILDYIYAVLHSPSYREKYKEFLKIDFPRVPYPKDKKTFLKLVKLGKELREIHLLESPKVEEYITKYPVQGDNVILRKLTETSPGFEMIDEKKQIGRVWINDEQYFDDVPLCAWEFYIGGYQPAQKWLKDRRERQLSYDEILHYQKIIVALTETDRIMKEIGKIDIK